MGYLYFFNPFYLIFVNRSNAFFAGLRIIVFVAHMGGIVVLLYVRTIRVQKYFSLNTDSVLHSLLVLFQATTLNVAFNSNNKSLLIIMMSNNVSITK